MVRGRALPVGRGGAACVPRPLHRAPLAVAGRAGPGGAHSCAESREGRDKEGGVGGAWVLTWVGVGAGPRGHGGGARGVGTTYSQHLLVTKGGQLKSPDTSGKIKPR